MMKHFRDPSTAGMGATQYHKYNKGLLCHTFMYSGVTKRGEMTHQLIHKLQF